MKQIVKALSGVEYNFVLKAEFYSDLKETLYKIYCHIVMCMNRQKVIFLSFCLICASVGMDGKSVGLNISPLGLIIRIHIKQEWV